MSSTSLISYYFIYWGDVTYESMFYSHLSLFCPELNHLHCQSPSHRNTSAVGVWGIVLKCPDIPRLQRIKWTDSSDPSDFFSGATTRFRLFMLVKSENVRGKFDMKGRKEGHSALINHLECFQTSDLSHFVQKCVNKLINFTKDGVPLCLKC